MRLIIWRNKINSIWQGIFGIKLFWLTLIIFLYFIFLLIESCIKFSIIFLRSDVSSTGLHLSVSSCSPTNSQLLVFRYLISFPSIVIYFYKLSIKYLFFQWQRGSCIFPSSEIMTANYLDYWLKVSIDLLSVFTSYTVFHASSFQAYKTGRAGILLPVLLTNIFTTLTSDLVGLLCLKLSWST